MLPRSPGPAWPLGKQHKAAGVVYWNTKPRARVLLGGILGVLVGGGQSYLGSLEPFWPWGKAQIFCQSCGQDLEPGGEGVSRAVGQALRSANCWVVCCLESLGLAWPSVKQLEL